MCVVILLCTFNALTGVNTAKHFRSMYYPTVGFNQSMETPTPRPSTPHHPTTLLFHWQPTLITCSLSLLRSIDPVCSCWQLPVRHHNNDITYWCFTVNYINFTPSCKRNTRLNKQLIISKLVLFCSRSFVFTRWWSWWSSFLFS